MDKNAKKDIKKLIKLDDLVPKTQIKGGTSKRKTIFGAIRSLKK